MTFQCGYCCRWLKTWEDLIDHIVNKHRWQVVDNKLERR
jgi:hypothetical protein